VLNVCQNFVGMWGGRLSVDLEEIITLIYENYKLSPRIKVLDIRLKVRCDFCDNNRHNDYCKEHCIEKE